MNPLNYQMAITRYKGVIKRNLEQVLNIILFKKIYQNSQTPLLEIVDYKPTNNDFIEYKEIYDNKKEIRNKNKLFKDYVNNNKIEINEFEILFKNNFNNTLDFKYFATKFFGEDSSDRFCHFCHIKESQINDLLINNEIHTKRIYSRGKTMEVDKIDSRYGYKSDNIVICCYWCNNAKTDEFTESEFKPVAIEISKVWKSRLSKIVKKAS